MKGQIDIHIHFLIPSCNFGAHSFHGVFLRILPSIKLSEEGGGREQGLQWRVEFPCQSIPRTLLLHWLQGPLLSGFFHWKWVHSFRFRQNHSSGTNSGPCPEPVLPGNLRPLSASSHGSYWGFRAVPHHRNTTGSSAGHTKVIIFMKNKWKWSTV